MIILSAVAPLRAEFVNGINVVVNDSVITHQDVQLALAPLADVLINQYRDQRQVLEQKLQETRTKQIEELVEKKVILEHYKTMVAKGQSFPEKAVDDFIRDAALQRFGDRVTMTKTLQAQGRTYESYRQHEREELIIGALTRQNVSSDKILVSPHKIELYYRDHARDFALDDQVKLRLIVLNKSAGAGDSTRKLAEEILAKIKSGAPFAEMASIYSDSQKAQGGDRGWIDRKYFKKEISDAAFALKSGQVSDVLDLPEACYLMLVEEAREAHVRPLDDVRAEIENTLRNQERVRLREKWIDRLKGKSFVQYYPL